VAKKFSLESVLSLVDGITAPVSKVEGKMLGFSKSMKKNFGGVGKQILSIDKQINKVIKSAAVMASGMAVAAGAMLQTMANSGDQFAKTSRMIGVTAEELQALTYAADMQGVSSETLNNSLKIMNRMMGELKTGSGTLYTYLNKTDKGLLNQLKSTKSNEEAFSLLIGKMHDLPDEFQKSAFAQAAFGRGGIEMLKLSEAGADGIKELTDEARRYGLITNDAAVTSEVYLDELSRYKYIAVGLKNSIASALLPKITELLIEMRKLFESSIGGISIAEKIKSAIDKIDVKKVVDGIVDFGKRIYDVGSKVAMFLSKTKPLIPWVLGAAGAIKILAIGIKGFQTATKIVNGLKVAVGGLSSVFKSMMKHPIISIIAIIIIALTVLYFKSEKFRNAVNKFVPMLTDFVKKAWPLIAVIGEIIAAIKIWSGVQTVINALLAANPIVLVVVVIAALIAYITIAVKKWDEFGAAMMLLFGPIGMLINFIMELRSSWESVVAAFQGGGIIAGLKSIGLVLIKSLIRPITQFLGLLSKIPGVDKLLSGAVEKLNSLEANIQADIDTYKNPTTQTAETRSYNESVSRIDHNVQITAPKGYGVKEGSGPPRQSLWMGAQVAQ